MFRALTCPSSGGKNCIHTASVIFALCKRLHSTLVESGLQSSWKTEESWFDSREILENFVVSKPALGSTDLSIQLVFVALAKGQFSTSNLKATYGSICVKFVYLRKTN